MRGGGRYNPQVRPEQDRQVQSERDRPRVLASAVVVRAARWGIVAWATIGVLVLAGFFFRYVVYPVRVIFPPLVVALIGVYLLNPIVSALERRRVPRIWGSLITYLVGIGLVGTAMVFVIPLVTEQVQDFARSAPRLIDQVATSIQDLASRFNVDVAAAGGGEGVVDFFGRLLSLTRGLLDLALVMILGPIIAFYLLVDLPKIRRGAKALIPHRRRGEAESILDRIGKAVGGFFRGQLLVSLFVGVASAIALWIVGLPFWAVVGLVTGVFNLIPLIGPFIGGIVAVTIAFTTEQSGGLLSLEPGWPLAIGSAVALLIVQQIDNHVLSPNIVARTVRLHPVTVMLGLLAGGTLLGLWGMLLAVPVLATVKILLLHAWDTKMQWPPPGSGDAAAGDARRPRQAPAPAAVSETEGGVPPPAAAAPADRPSEELRRAKEPASTTERRGSWWTSGLRGLFGPRRGREESPPAASSGR
jgi:predicted PurR-regulated permease PerM